MKLNEILKPKNKEEIFFKLKDLNLPLNYLLLASAEKGFLPGVKRALEGGVDVHTPNIYMCMDKDKPSYRDEYDGALINASENGHYDIVEFLIENGADVNVDNDHPLNGAFYYGHFNIVKLLLKHGANVYTINDYALQFASENGHYDVVELLKKWKEKGECSRK